MPLRSLRPNRSERDLNRRSTLDPAGLFKRGDKNKSAEHLTAAREALSHDGGRPDSSDVPRPSWAESHDERPPSPPIQEHTPNTRRFSMMRFRHASDTQLSTRAKEQAAADDAPPVPTMPTQTPAIITTAPTMVEQDEPLPKKRGRLQQFHLRRRSFDPSSTERPSLRRSMDKKSSSDLRRSPFSFMKTQPTLVEEPGRLSTNQHRAVAAGSVHEVVQEATSSLSLPVPRASESSRSDGSSGGHVSFENTAKRPATDRTGSGRFGFGRRNKQRASLFPLPMKIPPPEFPATAPATPRASTSGISSGSPHHSPGGESPPLTAIHHSRLQELENGSRTPPMPSPSQVALSAVSVNLGSPGAGSLFRNDSTRSIRSSRSSPNAAPMRLGMRGRSSTMGSLGGRSDDVPPPTPPYATSGRTSTSTAGRSSFSNLFGLSARFRQNSEPHSPRYGSPAHGFAGASGLSSHQNSLNISREALVMPKREEGETAGRYLERVEENSIDKSVIASYLTKTDDPFMLAVLRSYMRKFAFFGDPIDMAIRKLLMQVELPKETQQIDRVLQGFADRYHECNPGIFINPDKAYFISFSIVILHTDFFNKNNKRKMSRADYIKNSSCDGVSAEALGCFYDNVIYTPFIHVEDEVDLKATRRTKKSSVLKPPIPSMNDPAKRAMREPIDPYTLIFEGKLDILRPTIKDVMNIDDPYSYLGTAQALDTKTLYKSFSKYGVIQIVSSRSRPEAFMSQAAQENPLETSIGIVEMPVTKVGVLWRKDAKRKKARSPWQEWGAVLTRSGLSLFKNSGWAKNLMHQHDQHMKQGLSGPVVFHPPLQEFKQDHMIPMDRAVALVDNTYKKHKHAFVMSTKSGEETFLADNETDLNDWLGLLNYSAAFETLGVRPRGLVGGLYEGQRNRGIRRLESSHSSKSISTATGDVTIQSGRIDTEFAQEMMKARRDLMQQRISESEEKLTQSIKELESRLRDARHLQILAPIQPKTRELVIHAAGRLSAKLKWTRVEMWRMKCHRDILAQELEEEKQSASEQQARIDRIAGSPRLSQPQLSPQPSKEHRSSRISGIARLSSKTSSITSGQKPPLSPATSSARPGTKSSQDTDMKGDDVYRTPPETSRQSSPNQPLGQFTYPPLSFSPQLSDRRASFASSVTRSLRLGPKEHRTSFSTSGDGAVSSEDESDTEERYTTPPPPTEEHKDEHKAGQKAEPKTPELPAARLHLLADSDSDADRSPAALTGSPESRSKVRRSLQRTLRDSHGGPHHRRSHKGKDSASTVVSDDTQESEGLSRAKGSFTVHGKKASVITFGAEWHNMPAEERLKARKQAQEALSEAGSVNGKDGSTDGRAFSVTGDGANGIPTISEPGENTPRPTTANDVIKQRHVSSQTITPANYREALNGQDHDVSEGSEMGEIVEESSQNDQASTKQAQGGEDDSGAEHVRLSGPRSQAVEA